MTETALAIYAQSTPPYERTKTSEIRSWISESPHNSHGLHFFALKINDRVCGFGELRYIASSDVAIIDYLCVAPPDSSNAAYFTFLEMICGFVQNTWAPSYVVTELLYNPDGSTRDTDNRYWFRMLQLQGFKSTHAPYYQPSLEIDHPDQWRDAVLMVLSADQSEQLEGQRYIRIVKSIFDDHYNSWFSIYRNNSEQYKEKLINKLTQIEIEVRKSPYIKMNGSIRPNTTVEQESKNTDPTFPSIYFTLFNVVIVFLIAGSMFISASYGDLSVSDTILLFSSSVITYLLILSIALPQKITLAAKAGEIVKTLLSAR
ncbi:hypothetical protein E3C22_19725 [Jiella endophytica]|uniref:Uncharacterized protein n=1 Tax=Jiella endophytica TaxID=2558362 RepID=A0A4Y8RER7_9HYPH|nr:hypothetical protein [Jiella endophytica]TFF19890.1 hypothetical protein E3C22_19725 [Jiella endophytica]